MRILSNDLAAILMPWSRVSFEETGWRSTMEMHDWCLSEFGPVACNYFPFITGPELDAEIVFDDVVKVVRFSKKSVWDRVKMMNCGSAFIFKHERDAVHFKLRWG